MLVTALPSSGFAVDKRGMFQRRERTGEGMEDLLTACFFVFVFSIMSILY